MTSHIDAVSSGVPPERCPMMGNYGAPTITLVEGRGTEVWGHDGTRYLDFLCGLAVTSLGHCPPAVTEAICRQAGTLVHASNLYNTVPGPEVASRLSELIGSPGQVLFQNSGAEANEAAIKLARKYNGRGRHVVLSAFRSFHGRTLATLHATGQPEKHEAFQPLPEGFRHAAFDDIGAMEAALDDTVGAILVEPIQAEGGVNPPHPDYLGELRALCDDRHLLLIIDEIQTGMARTGEWFGFQHAGIVPDIVTVAKGLGNGMPIGAVWARPEVAEAFSPGDHGSTFAGQPLAAAAALAVLDEMARIDAPRLAAERGRELAEGLRAVDAIREVRGAGLLLAAEIDADALGDRTASDVAAQLAAAGLLVNGVTRTALRLAPPLTVSSEEIGEALTLIESVLGGGN